MSLEESLRQIVREEIRAAVRELAEAVRARPSGSPEDRLTLAEAAVMARKSSATVARWIETGALPCTRRGKSPLIARGDLEAYLRAEARPGTDAQVEEWAERMVRRGH